MSFWHAEILKSTRGTKQTTLTDQGQVDVVSLDLNSLELTQKLLKKLQINMAALMYLLIMPVYFQKQSNSP